MNITRWNELKQLEKTNPSELDRIGREIGNKIGLIWTKKQLTALDVMVAENKMLYPERFENIENWIK